MWLLQTIIFVRESDLIDQRRILSIIHAHCFKLSKNVPFQNMVENPSNALIHILCNFWKAYNLSYYFSLTDFKNNLVSMPECGYTLAWFFRNWSSKCSSRWHFWQIKAHFFYSIFSKRGRNHWAKFDSNITYHV